MSKNLLFVSIAFPPKNDPECVQSGRYAYYLRKLFKWNITVVTSKIPTLFMPYDKSLERLSKEIDKIEIPIFETKLLNKILSIVNPKLLSKPDSKFSFIYQWRKVVNRIQKPDIIYSRSFPLSSTLLALKLKKYYSIPWVMHLSDPWVESPLHDMTCEFHRKFEQQCFEQADAISFTTQQALELYQMKYPNFKNKYFVNTNVFEPVDSHYGENETPTYSGKINLVYTGGLANTRSASIFLRALSKAILKDPLISEKYQIIFAGDMDLRNRKLFEKYKYITCLKHIGILSQIESLKLQSTADILLVIDSKIREKHKNVFLPSKIIDYAANNKSIIAITEKESPSYNFIKKYGGVVFSFDDENKLCDYLIELPRKQDLKSTTLTLPLEYNVENQVSLLNSKLISLI